MDDHFYIGKKFSSYDEIKAVMRQYMKEKKVEFIIRDCKPLRKLTAERYSIANQALIYRRLQLCCFRGTAFKPRGKGFRNRLTCKTGCKANVRFGLSKCAQYLEVTYLCLDHNHELGLRPPSRIEKRAELRRRRLMERMKISYEEAVLLEKLKVSARSNRLVGPVEVDEDSIFDESSNHFESKAADFLFNSSLQLNASKQLMYLSTLATNSSFHQNVCSEDENTDERIGTKEQIDDDSRMPIDLNANSKAGKTIKRTNQTEIQRKDNEEHLISDDEDYRRPLIIPKSKPKKDDNNVSISTPNHFTGKEDDSDISIQELHHNSEKEDNNDFEQDNNDFEKEDNNNSPELKQNLFTRKGDDGMASTFSGVQKYKDDKIFEALGTIEELSSSIGFAKEFIPASCTDISGELVEVQCALQDMVIHVGTPRSSCTNFHRENSQFPRAHVTHLERLIAKHEAKLPVIKTIILPSGGQGSSGLHVARAICRRAERRAVSLVREGEVDRNVICYLNRLGDYLFVAARISSFVSGKYEFIYSKPSYLSKTPISSNINQTYSVIYLSQPNLYSFVQSSATKL